MDLGHLVPGNADLAALVRLTSILRGGGLCLQSGWDS
jgi:hypothetical protein